MEKERDTAMGGMVIRWLIVIGLPINLIVNYYYGKSLYELGVQMIFVLQKYSNPALDYFFIFFTLIVDPVFIISCCCLLMLLMKQKLLAFVINIFIMFNTFFLTISKSFYIAPRPYWTHQFIRNIGYYCPKDYGNPSGHAQFAAIMACVLLFQFIKERSTIYTCLGVFLMVSVSLSRMYLGGHSLNQVIQGLYLGISLSSLYCYGGLQNFITNLIVKQRSTYYKRILITIIAAMHLMYVYAFWKNRQLSQEHQKSAKIWVKNYNDKCNKSIDEYYLNFVMLNLNAALTNIMTGIIFGFKNMLGLKNINHYMKGNWKLNTKKYKNTFVCYIMLIGSQALLFSIGFLCFLPLLLVLGKNNISNFLYMNASCLISSYIYSSWCFKVLTKTQLIIFEEQRDAQLIVQKND